MLMGLQSMKRLNKVFSSQSGDYRDLCDSNEDGALRRKREGMTLEEGKKEKQNWKEKRVHNHKKMKGGAGAEKERTEQMWRLESYKATVCVCVCVCV